MALSANTKRVIRQALASQPAANEVIGCIGLQGGFVLNSFGTVIQNAGDVAAIPNSGGAAGTYRIIFPVANTDIQSIDWFSIKGFTPRSPTDVETYDARVTGYNFDASLKQWYITVQIVKLADGTIGYPAANFVVGVRVSVTLTPKARL